MNFKIIEEYLRELERGQTGGQAECINTFQLCWKVLKIDFFRKILSCTLVIKVSSLIYRLNNCIVLNIFILL